MCASPLSPRHAQPDWMGGGLVSRQMMHAPPSAAISFEGASNLGGTVAVKVAFAVTASGTQWQPDSECKQGLHAGGARTEQKQGLRPATPGPGGQR